MRKNASASRKKADRSITTLLFPGEY